MEEMENFYFKKSIHKTLGCALIRGQYICTLHSVIVRPLLLQCCVVRPLLPQCCVVRPLLPQCCIVKPLLPLCCIVRPLLRVDIDVIVG